MQSDKLISGLNGRGIKEEKLNIKNWFGYQDQYNIKVYG